MGRALKVWPLASAWGLAALALYLVALPIQSYWNWSYFIVWPGFIAWGLEWASGAHGWFSSLNSGWTLMAAWLAYLALTAGCLIACRKRIYFLLLGALCLLFALNVMGFYVLAHFHM